MARLILTGIKIRLKADGTQEVMERQYADLDDPEDRANVKAFAENLARVVKHREIFAAMFPEKLNKGRR